MKRLHLVFGIVVLFVFVLTGQYMDRVYAHLRGMADMPRMLFRSRHIYILLAGLLNLGLGTYLKRQPSDWRRVLQVFGSVLIVAATCLLVGAFFYEPLKADLQNTPFSRQGLYFIAAGTVFHVIAGLSDRP
jgi:hypothetical protein